MGANIGLDLLSEYERKKLKRKIERRRRRGQGVSTSAAMPNQVAGIEAGGQSEAIGGMKFDQSVPPLALEVCAGLVVTLSSPTLRLTLEQSPVPGKYYFWEVISSFHHNVDTLEACLIRRCVLASMHRTMFRLNSPRLRASLSLDIK